MFKVGKVTYEHNDDDATQCIPGGVGLKFGIVWKCGSIISLCLHTLVEPNIGDRDPEPRHKTCNSRHVGEPAENFTRACLDTHEAKKRKACAETNRSDGQSVRQSFKEYSGCISRQCQTVLTEKVNNIPEL